MNSTMTRALTVQKTACSSILFTEALDAEEMADQLRVRVFAF